MKINEVERLVGVTKGNIRFYEKEGLVTPGRNSDNGYREYSQADVVWLKKIKLLRMLDVPIEEILRLRGGELTLTDAMDRHLIQLQRRQTNLSAMQAVCSQLRERRSQLDELDVDAVLTEMEQQEQEGTKFMDVKQKDRRTKYIGPVIAAAVITVLMCAYIALIVWVALGDSDAPRWLAVFSVLPVIVIGGVLLALYQRVKQIKGGEEDAAAQY